MINSCDNYLDIYRKRVGDGFKALAFCQALWVLVCCDPGEIDLVSPEDSTAEVPALTIRAVLDNSHQDLAMTLGWTDGIPDAMVRVHNSAEPYDEGYWITRETNQEGLAEFQDLLHGGFVIIFKTHEMDLFIKDKCIAGSIVSITGLAH